MKKLLLCILLLSSVIGYSQNLEWTKKGLKSNGQIVTGDWKPYFESNPEALELVTKAKSAFGTSQVVGFIGGFLIGWPIGTAIGGGEPEWAMLGAGVGIVAIAIPIESGAKKKMKKAVDLISESPSSGSASLKFQFSGGAVGLAFNF